MTDTAKSLIEKAEEAAAKSMDPAQFDFLTALENDGVIMPRGNVKLFLDARLTAELLEKSKEHDRIVQAQADADKAETDRLRGEYIEELQAAETAAQKKWEEEEEGVLGGEDRVPMFFTEMRTKAVEVIPEIHSPVPDQAVKLLEEMDVITHKAYAARLEIELEGIQPRLQQEFEEKIEAEMMLPMQSKLPEEHKQKYVGERRANELVAGSIISVLDGRTGQVTDFSKQRMPAAAARRLIRLFGPSEQTKLFEVAQTLSYAAVLINLESDAGFLSGRTVSEGEPAVDTPNQNSEVVG